MPAWILVLLAAAATAQEEGGETAPAYEVRRGVIRFEEDVVKGEVQRPAVQILISRQDLGAVDTLDLRQDFESRIIDATLKPPF